MGIGRRRRLGELLVESGAISQNQLERALEEQRRTNERLGSILVRQGAVSERDIALTLSKQLGIPLVSLKRAKMDPKLLSLVPENIARRNLLIPVDLKDGKLVVAMADPLNVLVQDELRLLTGYDIEVVVAPASEIKQAIEHYYGMRGRAESLAREREEVEEREETPPPEEEAPVIQLVNSMISQAVGERASDIHIEPHEEEIMIRFRIDGVLRPIMTFPKSLHSLLTTRIKVMAGMNIAEKRLPQDGRILTSVDGRDLDLRVSTLPTVYGEKVVMRILDRSDILIGLEKLGLLEDSLEKIRKLISTPYGLILVTGPTGSGKTTTLYSILKELNSTERNIVTVEDPVEYQLEGINQVQVNERAGLTFSSVLRSVLRQDPDVIMVGEIRDTETAEIAIRSALTGHLVLSTLHTNDAPSAIARLIDMGVEPYLVASSVIGVIAQRLARRVCERCKEQKVVSESDIWSKEGIEVGTVYYVGKGCEECGYTGYKGRIGIFEIMLMSEEIQRLTVDRAPASQIRERAVKEGMITLRQDGIRKVKKGITTPDEVIRVTFGGAL